MIKCIYKVLLSLTVLTVTANLASAQMQTSPKKYFRGNSITLKLGVTETYTDIRTKDYGWASAGGQSELKPGFGLSINHMFSSVLVCRAISPTTKYSVYWILPVLWCRIKEDSKRQDSPVEFTLIQTYYTVDFQPM